MISIQREQFSLHLEREPFLGIAGEKEGETSLRKIIINIIINILTNIIIMV